MHLFFDCLGLCPEHNTGRMKSALFPGLQLSGESHVRAEAWAFPKRVKWREWLHHSQQKSCGNLRHGTIVVSLSLKGLTPGAREIAQLLKYLPHKQEDLSSDHQHHITNQVWQQVCHPHIGRWSGDPWGLVASSAGLNL